MPPGLQGAAPEECWSAAAAAAWMALPVRERLLMWLEAAVSAREEEGARACVEKVCGVCMSM